MAYNEQLNDKEMAMLMVILGNKPNLRSAVLNLLMESFPLDNNSPDVVHLMDESNAEPIKIIQNAIECVNCGEILISTHRHDFDECLCGNAVDGGLDYIRRIGSSPNITDLSVTTSTSPEVARFRLLWGTRGLNGDQPLVFKRIKDLETSHLEAILKTQQNASPIIRMAIQDTLNLRNDATGK